MKLSKPTTEIFINNGNLDHVKRIASMNRATRYLSQFNSYKGMAENAARSHDERLLYHASFYFIFKKGTDGAIPNWVYEALTNSDDTSCLSYTYHEEQIYFVSTNGLYLMRNPNIAQILAPHEVTIQTFVDRCHSMKYDSALDILRYSICVNMQFGTAYCLNVLCPYPTVICCNPNELCVPAWYESLSFFERCLVRAAWKISEIAERAVNFVINPIGRIPDDMISVLSSKVTCVYTLSFKEWKSVIDKVKVEFLYTYSIDIKNIICRIEREVGYIHHIYTGLFDDF